MRSVLFALAITALLSCGEEPQSVMPPTPQPPSESLSTLLSASVFSDGSTGMTCDLRAEVIAFQTLFEEPTAVRDFELLVKNGNLQGQLFGLCGFYVLAPERFDDLVQSYATSEERVLQAVPCMLANPQVSTLVRSDSPAAVRLRYRSQPLSEWLSEHPETTRKALVLDIVGGGFTAALLAADGCD